MDAPSKQLALAVAERNHLRKECAALAAENATRSREHQKLLELYGASVERVCELTVERDHLLARVRRLERQALGVPEAPDPADPLLSEEAAA